MKAVALLLFVLALFVAIFPQFYTCKAHGFSIVLPKGTIPMRCLWTAHAETTLGMILAVVAAGMWFLRGKETRAILCILGMLFGFAILMMPTRFLFGIGVCVNPDMPCVVYMRPALYTVAPLIIIISAVGLAMNLVTFKPWRPRE